MKNEEQHPEALLLDWHLDRLDDDQRSRVERALAGDADLRSRSQRLGEILQPLDHWTAAPTPPNLADKVLSRVSREVTVNADVRPVAMDAGRTRGFPLRSLRDFVAVAACIGLLIAAAIPSVGLLRDRSRRALCADHLGSIYRGVTTYKAMFAGSLPFAGRVPGGAWLPGGALDRPYASNSRHIYLLLKEHCDVQPRDFVCPGGPSVDPLPANEWAMYDDFPAAKHISYASANLAGPAPSLRPGNRLVYVSDPNPLFVNARFNADVDADKTNSPAHGGKGQTVLTLGGRVHWITTPLYGPSRDNLWLAGDIRRYTGAERPKTNDDMHLVPGIPASDPAVRRLRPSR